MPKEETIELIRLRNVQGELTNLPEDNPRAPAMSRIRALLLRMSGLPQLIHLYGALRLNKTLTLDTGENNCYTLFSDGSYIYAGLNTTPGKIVKVDLSDFTKVSTLTFAEDEDRCRSLFSDGNYLYAGLLTTPAKIVKVDLSDFTKVSTLSFSLGLVENLCHSLFSDGSYLYAGLFTTPAKIVKVDLSDFTKVSTLTFAAGEDHCRNLFSDGNYLYTGLDTIPAKIVKVDLSDFTKVSTLTFAAGENLCYTLFSDGSYIYAGLDTTPGKIVKVDLSDFTKVSTLTFAEDEFECRSLYIDGSYLYAGLDTIPAKIARRYIYPSNATLRERKIDRIYERNVEQSMPTSLYGKVTTYTNTTHFKVSTLGTFGNDFFNGWYVYVVRDAGGAGAAPQNEKQPISDYVSSDGTFTHTAFTTPLTASDEVLIIHPEIVSTIIASAVWDLDISSYSGTKAGTYLKTLYDDWLNGGRLDLLLDGLISDVDDLHLEAIHTTHLFPEATNETVTFTAGNVANTFGAWAEIVDNNAVTFSSKLTSEGGHISSIIIEQASVTDKVYVLEISYGDAKTIVSAYRIISGSVLLPPVQQQRIRAVEILVNETVYYRMACETADATLQLHLRYHHHP